jgi:hypothetical protein
MPSDRRRFVRLIPVSLLISSKNSVYVHCMHTYVVDYKHSDGERAAAPPCQFLNPTGEGMSCGERGVATTRKLEIVTEFDVWSPKDERQSVFWNSYVTLSLDYFTSLQQHVVPLDERHIAALAHTAMGLDVYAWLAQRLHRVPADKPTFLS